MTIENWQEQLRRGGLDLAILSTVAPGPRYGLEIIRHLEKFTDLVVTEGTIYPILGRLTRDGLLSRTLDCVRGPTSAEILPAHCGRTPGAQRHDGPMA